jgi:hypothetical protein
LKKSMRRARRQQKKVDFSERRRRCVKQHVLQP